MKLPRLPLTIFCLALLVWGCAPPNYRPGPQDPSKPGTDPVAGLIAPRPAQSAAAVQLPAMGYSIQVGMYTGNDRFIHAPRPGKKVREEKLSNDFFARTYVGGRSYL